MKQHAIIPIFIPHAGCPHQCAFCNQRTLTAQERDLVLLRRVMEQLLHQRLIGAVSDGEVESEHYSCSVRDGRVTVCLQARCSENIAKEQRK